MLHSRAGAESTAECLVKRACRKADGFAHLRRGREEQIISKRKKDGDELSNNNNNEKIILGIDLQKSAAQINADLKKLQSRLAPIKAIAPSESLQQTEKSMSRLEKLSKLLKDQMSQAASSFSRWLSAGSAATALISRLKGAVSDLKEVDKLLSQISRTNTQLSKSDLKEIGKSSFDIAGKYGKNAADYLSVVREASLSGYQNAAEIAKLSLALQSAGGMSAELATQSIIAADQAYQLGGSVEKLSKILDGSSHIANRNNVNMAELAGGMAAVEAQAAALGIRADETAAALGTMMSVTHQRGSEAAKAFQSILLYMQQVTDTEQGIDSGGLAEYEAACSALNVSLKETKNGVLALRNPMEVIRDLAAEYSGLSSGDSRRTNLLSSVGGGETANALDAILKNYDIYREMLQEYANGAGFLDAEAKKAADSWEGSLNRIGSTWNAVIGNIIDSDTVVSIINSLNSLLTVVDHVTDKLGPWGSIGAGAGLFAGLKNVGSPKMFGRKIVLNIPTVCRFCRIRQFRTYSL